MQSPAQQSAPPSSAVVQPGADGFIGLPVRSVEPDTDTSVVVSFDTSTVAPDVDLSFRAGQHLTLRREFRDPNAPGADPIEIRRSYSLCAIAPDGGLRIAVRRVDGGVFSTWLTTELAAGTTIDVLPPTGKFTHVPQPQAIRRYMLVAGGSGITPIYAIAATILAGEPSATVDLLYVNQTATATMLLDDVLDLRDRYLDRCRVTFVFTRETTEGNLLSGRPDLARLRQLIDAGLLQADADEVFMCGPVGLLDEVQTALVGAGTDPDRIHREVFSAPQQGSVRLGPQALDDSSVVIADGVATLHNRSSTFAVYEGDTILEAVERVRRDAPYSCRAGVCSTCQAVMPAGTVSMDVNHGLTADEVARGYVLTCQARPTQPGTSLRVNFDV